MQEALDFFRSRQPVNLAVVLTNIVVFIVLSIMGDTEDGYFMVTHGANYAPYVVEYGEYYRLLTCMFMHFGIQHLFNNMLVLIFLGDEVERLGGKLCYLVIYILGGIAGNIVSVVYDLHTGFFSVSAGASGAVFSVIGALLAVVLLNRGKIPRYTKQRMFLMASLSVLQGLTATGVDNCAHIGGLIFGFLLAMLFHGRLTFKTKDSVDNFPHSP
ncbi:MAG: rhomboid family intramembrane serine protease [Lachnospiraceae bacterium]|nr:rhomboid family intramembrane serine protease [Lachnospiraceae bacterium]